MINLCCMILFENVFVFALQSKFCPAAANERICRETQGLVLRRGKRHEIKFGSIKLRDISKGRSWAACTPCSTTELDCSQIRASRSGRDLTLKESEVTAGEYEMSLVLVRDAGRVELHGQTGGWMRGNNSETLIWKADDHMEQSLLGRARGLQHAVQELKWLSRLFLFRSPPGWVKFVTLQCPASKGRHAQSMHLHSAP